MSSPSARQSYRRQVAAILSVAIALLALSLVAVRPILSNQLTCADDNALHLLRLTELDYLLGQGVVYSRWAPNMALGYGYPLFNFYAPLSYYVAALVSWLVDNLHLGLRLTFAISLYASGLAAYRLARDHFRPTAALVGAVAFVYAPYQAYDILFRGNLAESLAWPLLPLSLWCVGRLARTARRRWLAATAISYAAVLLTHNIFALIFSPMLAAYGLSEAVGASRQSGSVGQRLSRTALPSVLLSLGLGLGLAAFFWLPALLEQQYVHIDRLFVPSHFVYSENFVSFEEILAPPRPIHPDVMNPSPARALGLVPALLALPGVILGWRLGRDQRRQTLFFGLAAVTYVFMMLPVSAPVWQALPFVEFIQFPWRLLGPAALAVAMLAAASIQSITGPNRRAPAKGNSPRQFAKTYLAPLLFCLGLIAANLSWLDARYCAVLEDPTVADILAFEEATQLIGTTAAAEYLPLTSDRLPEQPATQPFAPSPEEVTLETVDRQPLRLKARIKADTPFTLTANVLTFPGWQATIDGARVPIRPSPGTGLITVPVPAGQHAIEIRLGSTPARMTGGAVSLLSAAVILLLSWRGSPEAGARPSRPQTVDTLTLLLFTGLGIGLAVLVSFVLHQETPLRYPIGNALVQRAEFSNGLILFERDGPVRSTAADQPLTFDLFWMRSAPLQGEYQATVQLVDAAGQLWSPKGTTRPRGFRPPGVISSWPPDQLAQDVHLLLPLPGTPPGLYDAQLILFDQATLAPVPLLSGQPALSLGSVEITRPATPATAEDLTPQYDADTSWEPDASLQLVGYSLDRAEARPGDPVAISLFWNVVEAPRRQYDARLVLQDLTRGGVPVLERRISLASNAFPTTEWLPGDAWRVQETLQLPAELPGGSFQWTLRLCVVREDCLPGAAVLGTLNVSLPDRVFVSPEVDIAIDERVGGLATLRGMSLSWQADRLQVTLVWQPISSIDRSYHVFVHLVDDGGQLVAQSDGEPAQWTRPTTSWVLDEYVVDEHQLLLPVELTAGPLSLRVGLYDVTSGERLPTGSGDFVSIPVAGRP